jgi:hypothetical protein
MKYVLAGLGIFVALMLFGWLIQGNDFFMYKVFAPKYEKARRETYEQTKVSLNGRRLAGFWQLEYGQGVPDRIRSF